VCTGSSVYRSLLVQSRQSLRFVRDENYDEEERRAPEEMILPDDMNIDEEHAGDEKNEGETRWNFAAFVGSFLRMEVSHRASMLCLLRKGDTITTHES